MKRLALALSLALLPMLGMSVALATGKSPVATDARFEAILKRIDPSDRLMQICDYAAVKRIGQDKTPYRPDRAVLSSLSAPNIHGNTARGSGGAFRSNGQWYQFSYVCETSPDRLKILSFDYRIGEKIPEQKWDEYGLWR
jgi:Domain of Unknown Function (DUF930)